MKLYFFIRGNVIHFALNEEGKSTRVSTGIKVPFSAKMRFNRILGDSFEGRAMNTLIRNKEKQIRELYDKGGVAEVLANLVEQPKRTDSKDMIDMLTDHIARMQGSEKKYSKNTITLYQNSIKHLTHYTYLRGSMNLVEASVEGNAEEKKKKGDAFLDYFADFNQFLIDRKFIQNTRATIFSTLNIMFGAICKRNYISLPTLPLPKAKINPVFVLNPDLVRRFIMDEYGLYEALNASEKHSWEVSATILVTTLRISDATSLAVKDLDIDGEDMYLLKLNKKTGVYSRLPLPRTLTRIYRQNISSYGSIYTPIGEKENLNKLIRQIFSKIEDCHREVNIRRTGVTGEEVVKTMPIWKAVSPHMLRKSAITTMIYNGVNERHIKFASGHSYSSAAFDRYVGFVEERFKSDMTDYYQKMGI